VFNEVKFPLNGGVVGERAIEQQRQNKQRNRPNSPHVSLYGAAEASVSNRYASVYIDEQRAAKVLACEPN
jgi:hypothetical protein